MEWYEDFTLMLISVTVKVNIYVLYLTFINSTVYCFYNFLTTSVMLTESRIIEKDLILEIYT